MMSLFLKFKHWQLFILSIIFPIIYYFLSRNNYNDSYSSLVNLNIVMFGIVATSFSMIWILFIGLSLNRLKSNPYKYNVTLFIIALVFSSIGYFLTYLDKILESLHIFPVIVSAITTPLSFFGIVFSVKNVAQSLNSIEKGEKAIIKDYFIDILLFLMFPIGIWIIQPRLNNIYIEKIKR